jgi:hypothetical protein
MGKYKVLVLGRDPVEVVADDPEQAVVLAGAPADWQKEVAGEVITVLPQRIAGG